jgi:SAC3 family protein LENG8/THP3
LLAGRKTVHKEVVSGSAISRFEPFIGTNMNLEKDYLRLTTYPRKEDVRPYEVLMNSLSHVKRKYIDEEDFDWVNSQLKSIRQDITCQSIRNIFVLDVYETHARILLEHGDLNEFNQCQTMIRSLTEKTCGVMNEEETTEKDPLVISATMRDSDMKDNILQQSRESMFEFCSYALLYALIRNSRLELIRELDRMNDFLTPDGTNGFHDTCCEHALHVVRSVEENNYRAFFKLYRSAPHMTAYLMDFLVKRVRDQAYERITASYRPNVSVEHMREWLHFDDFEDTRRYLRQRNAVFVEIRGEAPFWIDCKASK